MLNVSLLSRDEIASRLSGLPEERAAFVHEAADAGHAEAQVTFGQMLLDGIGVPADARTALGYFKRAAAQHHAMGINMVGRCYDLGWGTEIDHCRAVACFRIAAELGLPWAMYNLATAMALGSGVAEDRSAALALLERAAANDDGLAGAKSLNFIGSFAEDGWAGPRDLARATLCYMQAAVGGDFRGCFNHARMLAAAGDIDAAVGWIGRASEMGHDRFRAQMRDWLSATTEPLRSRGLAAC